jgi:hypothetical protein
MVSVQEEEKVPVELTATKCVTRLPDLLRPETGWSDDEDACPSRRPPAPVRVTATPQHPPEVQMSQQDKNDSRLVSAIQPGPECAAHTSPLPKGVVKVNELCFDGQGLAPASIELSPSGLPDTSASIPVVPFACKGGASAVHVPPSLEMPIVDHVAPPSPLRLRKPPIVAPFNGTAKVSMPIESTLNCEPMVQPNPVFQIITKSRRGSWKKDQRKPAKPKRRGQQAPTASNPRGLSEHALDYFARARRKFSSKNKSRQEREDECPSCEMVEAAPTATVPPPVKPKRATSAPALGTVMELVPLPGLDNDVFLGPVPEQPNGPVATHTEQKFPCDFEVERDVFAGDNVLPVWVVNARRRGFKVFDMYDTIGDICAHIFSDYRTLLLLRPESCIEHKLLVASRAAVYRKRLRAFDVALVNEGEGILMLRLTPAVLPLPEYVACQPGKYRRKALERVNFEGCQVQVMGADFYTVTKTVYDRLHRHGDAKNHLLCSKGSKRLFINGQAIIFQDGHRTNVLRYSIFQQLFNALGRDSKRTIESVIRTINGLHESKKTLKTTSGDTAISLIQNSVEATLYAEDYLEMLTFRTESLGLLSYVASGYELLRFWFYEYIGLKLFVLSVVGLVLGLLVYQAQHWGGWVTLLTMVLTIVFVSGLAFLVRKCGLLAFMGAWAWRIDSVGSNAPIFSFPRELAECGSAPLPKLDKDWTFEVLYHGHGCFNESYGADRIGIGFFKNVHIPLPCVHSVLRAGVGRQGIEHAEDALIDPTIFEWADKCVDFLFPHTVDLEPYTLTEWIDSRRWKGSKKDGYRRYFPSLVVERMQHYHIKAFIKMEVMLYKLNPRLPGSALARGSMMERFVMSSSDQYCLTIGPYIAKCAEYVKKVMSPESPFVYACMSPNAIGQTFWEAYERGLTAWFTTDYSKFDSHQHEFLLKIEHRFYERIFGDNWEEIRLLMESQWVTKGYASGFADGSSVRFTGKWRRRSGDQNTSLGNTLVNYFAQFAVMCEIFGFDEFLCILESGLLKMAILGDDVVALTTHYIRDKLSMSADALFKRVGLPLSVFDTPDNYNDVIFLQNRFYSGVGGFTLLPRPERIFTKTFLKIGKHPLSLKDGAIYCAAICEGLLSKYVNTPIVTPTLEKMFQLSNTVAREGTTFKHRRDLRRNVRSLHYTWYDDDGVLITTRPLSEEGLLQFREFYSLSAGIEEGLMLWIRDLQHFAPDVQHPWFENLTQLL